MKLLHIAAMQLKIVMRRCESEGEGSRHQQIIFYYDRVCVELILDSKNNNLLRLQIAHGYRQQQKNGEKRGGQGLPS